VKEFYTYINPRVIDKSRETVEMNEYCLSIGFNEYCIRRPKFVQVEYYREDGSLVEERMDSLRSRILQHEMDHLDGILMS
jgi:peptide deformylase